MRIFLLVNLFTVFLFSLASANLRSFEGNINFVRETAFDITYITILVKGSKVRVDEHDNSRRLLSSHLINLDDEKVIALSHDRKLFLEVPVRQNLTNGNFEIRKTGNHKEIKGQVCYQWRVRDVKRNTEIAYWVYPERFEFFESLLRLLNRTELSLSVFKDIPENGNFFPMLTEERTLLRKEKLRMAVVDINETNLNSKLFEIPNGYKQARR